MAKIIECVPNISEGRNTEVIEACVDQIRNTAGVTLLDYSSDASHNRSVITFMGNPEGVMNAAVALAKKAVELIDLNHHQGEHPRMGAVDVCPFDEMGVRAVEAGADLLLVCHDYGHQQDVYNGLLKAVQSGRIPEKRIDESVRRILRSKLTLGEGK